MIKQSKQLIKQNPPPIHVSHNIAVLTLWFILNSWNCAMHELSNACSPLTTVTMSCIEQPMHAVPSPLWPWAAALSVNQGIWLCYFNHIRNLDQKLIGTLSFSQNPIVCYIIDQPVEIQNIVWTGRPKFQGQLLQDCIVTTKYIK